ncbi:gamma-glutamyl phosphate reductase [Kordiimonas sediminis]|uniref:Gamma-glutamyl phosphate reductase n=1 Tax=Kordiimonas sediminis TaxID=1735581 RepID=A0A919AJ20_9PROT|nr:glutamate-5-semialdehyde dehydrogenase [Kordiimonas sediminis]GHF11064.1 gamma-glutamyl phosphate reductase [Kordiimonas sediminis]
MTALSNEIKDYIYGLAEKAKIASKQLATASTEQKNQALLESAGAIRKHAKRIITENAKDVESARADGKPASFIDRLTLTSERVEAMADAIEQVAKLPDPVGRQLASFDRPNGLRVERVAVPIGVIGMIFESRPNVGADAGSLCLKSGNAVILRGGSESYHSTTEIVSCLKTGLAAANLPEDSIQVVETIDRDAVKYLLKCSEYIDLIIPRGGKGLVSLVKEQAEVPTLEHLDGNCHTYIHGAADMDKAVSIVHNAKMRRTGICGATESLVIDASIAAKVLPKIIDAMPDCEFRGDNGAISADSRVHEAYEEDFGTEFLDAILSVKIVEDIDEAISFVDEQSSQHTDAIITEDQEAADLFMNKIDSAVVMHNASTQFSDGGEFGMGAEIGIATGKMHARGPVGLEQLTTFKYKVHGSGQTRS